MTNINNYYWVILALDGNLLMGSNSPTKGFYNSEKIALATLRGQIKLCEKAIKYRNNTYYSDKLKLLNSSKVVRVQIKET